MCLTPRFRTGGFLADLPLALGPGKGHLMPVASLLECPRVTDRRSLLTSGLAAATLAAIERAGAQQPSPPPSPQPAA